MLKKKEAEDAKALEDMVQKVESNLVTTTVSVGGRGKGEGLPPLLCYCCSSSSVLSKEQCLLRSVLANSRKRLQAYRYIINYSYRVWMQVLLKAVPHKVVEHSLY